MFCLFRDFFIFFFYSRTPEMPILVGMRNANLTGLCSKPAWEPCLSSILNKDCSSHFRPRLCHITGKCAVFSRANLLYICILKIHIFVYLYATNFIYCSINKQYGKRACIKIYMYIWMCHIHIWICHTGVLK